MVFRREHVKLRKDGEEWMKKTADSYTITASLIITVVFAAAITVPGGNDSVTGKPIYQTKSSLIIFAKSDAISLFTSTTSLLLFLSILTARYADEDFLYKLPKRLIFGLVMLFVSMTAMMIAFSATLYIMFGQEKQWILIPIGALAGLPIASFVTLQFSLLVELILSTYGHGIRAQAFIQLVDLDLAEMDINEVLSIDPDNDRDVKLENKGLKERMKEYNKKDGRFLDNILLK
nr:ankyrin repeat family protein [Tanacetum cinerariifolium]